MMQVKDGIFAIPDWSTLFEIKTDSNIVFHFKIHQLHNLCFLVLDK